VAGKNPIYGASETLLIGAIASGIAYFVGVFLQGII
jgi:ABC-type dipeptide/oligopeptide/nickel transport system permease subunit